MRKGFSATITQKGVRNSVTILLTLLLSLNVLSGQGSFLVQTAVNPTGAGTVAGSGEIETGKQASLEAAAETGYIFSGWSGSLISIDNPLELLVEEDLEFVAQFVPDTRDFDSDGLSNYEEAFVYLSDPFIPDTDSDGVSDGAEIKAGTNPNHDEGGVLLIYEGFDYNTKKVLLAQMDVESGIGWQGPWGLSPDGGTSLSGAMIQAGSLTHEDLQTEGSHLYISGEGGSVRIARSLQSPFDPTEGGSLYISWIGQRLGEEENPPVTSPPNPFPRGADLRFWDELKEARLNLGNLSNQDSNTWKVIARDSTFDTGHSFSEGVNFFVLRIDFAEEGEADLLHLWINPDLSLPEDLSRAQTMTRAEESRGPWKLKQIQQVGFFVGDSSSDRPHAEFIFDELRMGTGYRAVIPRVPDPNDSDKDGLEDAVETDTGIFQSAENTGTDPNLFDSDFDGLSDGDEVHLHGTNPNQPDTDKDTLTDGAEVLTHTSNPLLVDSDGDTFSDPLEVGLSALGFDPAVDSSALITLVKGHAQDYGLIRPDQLDQIVVNGIAVDYDPDEDGFFLNLNLWRSSSLNEWNQVELFDDDLRGTDTGLMIRLPQPVNNPFYQIEIPKE